MAPGDSSQHYCIINFIHSVFFYLAAYGYGKISGKSTHLITFSNNNSNRIIEHKEIFHGQQLWILYTQCHLHTDLKICTYSAIQVKTYRILHIYTHKKEQQETPFEI